MVRHRGHRVCACHACVAKYGSNGKRMDSLEYQRHLLALRRLQQGPDPDPVTVDDAISPSAVENGAVPMEAAVDSSEQSGDVSDRLFALSLADDGTGVDNYTNPLWHRRTSPHEAATNPSAQSPSSLSEDIQGAVSRILSSGRTSSPSPGAKMDRRQKRADRKSVV